MTRALSVSAPVRCGQCGTRFVREHARQVRCLTCRPNRDKSRAAAGAAPVPVVPGRLHVRAGFPRDDYSYTAGERRQAMKLALRLARTAAGAIPAAGECAAELTSHVGHLLTYARSVAHGVVPGSLWQSCSLGFRISPCDGRRNPYLQPRPDEPETLSEAAAADRLTDARATDFPQQEAA